MARGGSQVGGIGIGYRSGRNNLGDITYILVINLDLVEIHLLTPL